MLTALSPEVGYKRGKELQWYQPQNAVCQDGRLIITARRERAKPAEAKCRLANYNPGPTDPVLSDDACSVCAPPNFNYGDPCDLLQNGNSGAPVCDCSASAEYTSASLRLGSTGTQSTMAIPRRCWHESLPKTKGCGCNID